MIIDLTYFGYGAGLVMVGFLAGNIWAFIRSMMSEVGRK